MCWEEKEIDTKYILYLLDEIQKMDTQYKFYGSFVHQYDLNSCMDNNKILEFEQLNNIELPKDYKAFINQVGNGGAGPIYGLDTLEIKKIENLNKPCRLRPDMSDEEWNIIAQKYIDGELEFEEVFQGILCIGNREKTGLIGLVVIGECFGQVVYYDFDVRKKPVFVLEGSFDNWYKTWLEGICKGYDMPLYGLSTEVKHDFNIKDKKLLFHINNTIGGKGCLPVVMQDMNKIIKIDLSKKLDYNSFETMYDMSNVYDISSLVYAKRMRKINLSNNRPENMFILGFCESLKEINIRNTNTKTTYLLKNLKNLETLDLSNNNIKKLLYMENMKNIKKLNIAFNPINDYTNIEKLNYSFDLIIDKNQKEYVSKLKNFNNINITIINEIKELEKIDLSINNKENLYLSKNLENRKDVSKKEKVKNFDNLEINYENLKKYKNLLFVENDEISKKEYFFNKEIEKLSKEDHNNGNNDNAKLSKDAMQLLRKGKYEEALNIYKKMTDFMINPNVYRNIVLCYKNLIKKEENLKKRNLKLEDNEDAITVYKEKRFEYAYKSYLLFPNVESSVLDLANIYLEMDEKIEFDVFNINRRPELLKAKLILEKLLNIKPDSTGAKALLFSIVNGYKWNSCDKNCIYKG